MKPVIVDRVIFSLVNRHQLDAQKHFEYLDTGAVLLNADGKRLVLTEMEDKLHTKLMIKDSSYTYLGLIERDVAQLKDYILQKTGEKKRFKPY
ncbi:TPA: CRISPR-associated endonuclease Cas1 [Streptococcus suis]|nr:CRISPR-associated endonuclease Cas1 [Streptococcus suis]